MNAKLLSLLIVLSAVGCEKPPVPKPDDKKAAKADDDDHEHGPGPHGGTVLELGGRHGEFVVDHAKKTATVYVLDGKVKNPAPIPAAKLLLSIQQPRFQADLVAVPQAGDPTGTSSRFVATHDNFGKEQEFAGTVSGEIDGKPYLGDFQEGPHKDHDHGKK